MSTVAQSLEQMAVRSSTDAWFETYGVIEDANNEWYGRGQPHPLLANFLQAKISAIAEWVRGNNLPLRLLILKPRQRGCSTFSVSDFYCESMKRPIKGAIIGATLVQPKNLYGIFKTYANRDEFDWGVQPALAAEGAKIDFPSGQEGEVKLFSAKQYDPGRSGTLQYVLATEAARWAEEGVANAAEVLSGLLKCVQLRSGTSVILETTAQGASGDFYNRWQDALEFEEFQDRYEAGENVRGEYIRVFAPWFAFPELSIALTPSQKDRLRETLGRIERYNSPDFGPEPEMAAKFGLTLEQLAWRRYAIDKECERDPRKFEQDYPSTWETAFLTSGDRRFNGTGLRVMREAAKAKKVQWGMLDLTEDRQRVNWQLTDAQEGLVKRWEEPREGERYLISVDVMTGEDQTTGKDPDKHSLGVLRAGKWVQGRGWVKPALVARLKTPCRWEVDLLADWVRRFHLYYRGAIICPEINNPGLALLQCLKPLNLPIYQREVLDEFEQRMVKQLGWKTTPGNKPMIIATLASAIRDYDVEGNGIDVWDEDCLDELGWFARVKGKEQAVEGKHDDDVIMLAIGLTLIENATHYVPPYAIRSELPPDLRRMFEEEEKGRRGPERMQYS